ncbi:MAG: Na+/H+ antiporter subunit E [Thiogranum sp.]|jgi:multicomponent K+:H+ antiporter subunit E
MRGARTLLPHPLLSLLLLLLWLLLNNSATAGQLVLGTLFGVIIPLFTRRFWPQPAYLAHPGRALSFAGRVLWDIIVANFTVARLVLGPRSAIRPVFVRVPLEVEGEFATTLLLIVISLTPGTVTADLDEKRRHLLVHALSEDDPDELVRQIKRRYETVIKEILKC